MIVDVRTDLTAANLSSLMMACCDKDVAAAVVAAAPAVTDSTAARVWPRAWPSTGVHSLKLMVRLAPNQPAEAPVIPKGDMATEFNQDQRGFGGADELRPGHSPRGTLPLSNHSSRAAREFSSAHPKAKSMSSSKLSLGLLDGRGGGTAGHGKEADEKKDIFFNVFDEDSPHVVDQLVNHACHHGTKL